MASRFPGGDVGEFLDVDIERIEKQPAVRRIGAAIGRTVVEQGMQRIETDAVGAQLTGEPDQRFEIGKIPDSPVARRADAVKLDRQQPAAVEIAVESPRRRHDQWRLLGERGGVGEMQPVGADRQIGRPVDDPVARLAFGDNLKSGNDFPPQRKRGSLAEFGPRGPAGPDHHRLAEKPVRDAHRQGIEDDLQRHGIRHMAVTLAVDKFGLDSEVFSSFVKVHSARRLHATVGDVANFSR